MRVALKQTFVLLLFFVGIYTSLIVCFSALSPMNSSSDRVDTGDPAYLDDMFEFYISPSKLMKSDKKILLFGGSNVREGFRPAQMGEINHKYSINNLAIGGSNITQVKNIVDQYYGIFQHEKIPDTIFIIGIWYGIFVDDQTMWPNGLTNVEVDQLRYPIYWMVNGAVQPIVPYNYLPMGITLFYPYVNLMHWYRKCFSGPSSTFTNFRAVMKSIYTGIPVLTVDMNSNELNEDQRVAAMAQWQVYMGNKENILDEQFVKLDQMLRMIGKSGNRAVLVDLPLPQWHRDRSPHFKFYQMNKMRFLSEIQKIPHVTYLNMQNVSNNDQDFYDSAHPRPKVTSVWGNWLAKALMQIM